MINREDLKIGMKVVVQGKRDIRPYEVEILDFGESTFVHKSSFVISVHNYSDIVKINE